MNRPVKITGAGTAMLLMLFFILCLTVLCALGLLSASADLRLARTYAASVQTYYEADEQASRVLRALLRAELENPPETIEGTKVSITQKNGRYLARYLCAAGEHQALYVEIVLDGAGNYRTQAWRLESTLEYSVDEHINVWRGEGAMEP